MIPTSSVDTSVEYEAPPAEVLAQRAYDFAQEVQNWGECVSAAAREHYGGTFDPAAACGETPTAADRGLVKTQAPGQAKATDRSAEADQPVKPGQPEKPDQPVKPGQPEKTDPAEKPDHPEKPDRAD